jgi:hypothetical protein
MKYLTDYKEKQSKQQANNKSFDEDTMSSNLGRNEQCPCGSGKKYKKCCISQSSGILSTSPALEVADFAWHKLRQLEGVVIDEHLLPFVQKISEASSYDLMMIAADELFPDDLPEALDKELLFHHFFLPWFLFDWIPYEDLGMPKSKFDVSKTIAQNYLKIHLKTLGLQEREFIEAMNKTHYSFYTVLDVKIDKALIIRDILLGKAHEIKERQGTHHLKRGDIVFTRILTLDNQSISIGMAPCTIPADYGSTLLDFKKWLIEENDGTKLTKAALRNELDLELTDCFFSIISEAYGRPLPVLHNTDGELIQFSKSYFKLTMNIEEALKKLLPMALSKDPTEFLEDANFDKSGKIKSIELPWLKKGNKAHKTWNNTVMGHIQLEQDGRLILETNSHQRSEQGKTLLLKYLKTAITFQQTLIESPEQKLKSFPASSNTNQIPQDVMQSPEMQEQLKQMVKSHWDNWFTSVIPALGNKTPRAAAKTKAGREMLDALLLQYERYDLESGDNLLKADIGYLRSELGLS